MHKSLRNLRFSIKPQKAEGDRPVELARTLGIHPLTYQELPYDPEYSHYAGRLTLEKLSNAFFAASTALSTSKSFPSDSWAISSSFAGFKTGINSLEIGSTQLPSI